MWTHLCRHTPYSTHYSIQLHDASNGPIASFSKNLWTITEKFRDNLSLEHLFHNLHGWLDRLGILNLSENWINSLLLQFNIMQPSAQTMSISNWFCAAILGHACAQHGSIINTNKKLLKNGNFQQKLHNKSVALPLH